MEDLLNNLFVKKWINEMTPTPQLFTLDQISEMVRAGIFSPPAAGEVSQDLTNSDRLNNIFLSQIAAWSGGGMKVKIESKEKCKDCGLVFKEGNKFSCTAHERWAKRVYIVITGLGDSKYGRERIYSDKNNLPLSIEAAIRIKTDIVEAIKSKTFNIKRYLPRSRQTFLFENYKREYLKKMGWRASLSPGETGWMSTGHLKGIKGAFNNYLNYFDDFDIQNIKAKHIDDWIDELKTSRDHKRKLIGYLSHMLRWAKSREDLTAVPTMPTIIFMRKKKKGLLEEGQLEILEKIPERDRPVFRWVLETGRRVNEYRALKVCDLDFKRGVYRVGGAFDMEHYKPYPKIEGHAGEEFPLSGSLLEIIKTALKDRVYGADSFLFVNRIGNHYTDGGLRKIYNAARERACYPSITLNMFGRHSMGYKLKMAGASDEEIASVLGNTAKIVHETYTHVEAGNKSKILSLLDKRREKEASGFAPGLPMRQKS